MSTVPEYKINKHTLTFLSKEVAENFIVSEFGIYVNYSYNNCGFMNNKNTLQYNEKASTA